MHSLPPELAEYANLLRASFPARAPEDEILVDTMVSAAIRLKILYHDPRAIDPFDVLWTRIHTATLRAFFRAHDALTRRRRPNNLTRATVVPGNGQPADPLDGPALSPSHPVQSNPQILIATAPQMASRPSESPDSDPTGTGVATSNTSISSETPTNTPENPRNSASLSSNASAAPPVNSKTTSEVPEPTFDDLLRRPLRRDLRNRKLKLLETHVLRHAVDRIVPISAIPPRASP